jgi:UDP-glucose 4-epimerase
MILLTGVSGFIGKHLLLFLIEKYGKENILALTSMPISECRYLIHNNYQFEQDFFAKNGCQDIDTIIHAGAFIPKKAADANEIDLSNSNIYNTEKLLNVNFPKLKKFIFLSTIDVYDNSDLINENTLEKPVSLYGYSKLYCEKMIEIWAKKNNKIFQILRIGHVYGPGEEAYNKIIPVSFKKTLKNEPLQLLGAGNELRSFIYIIDVVEAIIKSKDLIESIGIVNLVSGQSLYIKDLVNAIRIISGTDLEIEILPTNNIGRSLVFDNSKMRKWLLENETSLEVGLKEEFEYMKTLINY